MFETLWWFSVHLCTARWRMCLKDEIKSRWEHLYGCAPDEALQYKSKILRLFVSNGRSVQVRRVLLILCPNGDWRSSTVQFYTTPGSVWEGASEQDILEHLTKLDLLVAAVFKSVSKLNIFIPHY